jgi:hypothetical protein
MVMVVWFVGKAFPGRGRLQYRISEAGRSPLRWLRRPTDYERAVVVDAEKKENEREKLWTLPVCSKNV